MIKQRQSEPSNNRYRDNPHNRAERLGRAAQVIGGLAVGAAFGLALSIGIHHNVLPVANRQAVADAVQHTWLEASGVFIVTCAAIGALVAYVHAQITAENVEWPSIESSETVSAPEVPVALDSL